MGKASGDDKSPKRIVNYQRAEFPDTFQAIEVRDRLSALLCRELSQSTETGE